MVASIATIGSRVSTKEVMARGRWCSATSTRSRIGTVPLRGRSNHSRSLWRRGRGTRIRRPRRAVSNASEIGRNRH